jgi:signal peptidase II
MPSPHAWFGLSAAIVVLDQLTKYWITGLLRVGETIPVTDFFQLVLTYNPGAAFSFLSQASGWQRWFFIVLALGISAWLIVLIRQHRRETLLAAAFALVLGGAIGNVIDRFLVGAVIDFLYFHVGRHGWPAFNVADSAITIGVVLLIWDHIRAGRKTEAARQP